uniref:D,D-heptose 1,7-bisphosphate phosphatase n=1 Tax=viral metagenome TaxID=1070528 RepID=A0A6M3LSP8_9ZZZZ
MVAGVFLDRDGVICANDPEHVRSWADFHFLPSALDALVLLALSDLAIVIITNQPAVGQGLMTQAELSGIHAQMADAIRDHGGHLDGIYSCPHTAEDGCDCRKPKPGLIVHAARYLEIDRARSYLIGDSTTDVEAGLAAGLRCCYLVLSGRYDGRDLSAYGSRVCVVEDLATAVRCILADGGREP